MLPSGGGYMLRQALIAPLFLLITQSASAAEGRYSLVTVDGVPPHVLFTEGVAKTVVVNLRFREFASTNRCHRRIWAEFGIAGPLTRPFPCYGANVAGSTPYPDAELCTSGVGADGLATSAIGGTVLGESGVSYPWEIRYDGSSLSVDTTHLSIFDDGGCYDVDPEPEPYEIARINIHFRQPSEQFSEVEEVSTANATSNWAPVSGPFAGDVNSRLFVTGITEYNGAQPSFFGVWWTGTSWAVYNEGGQAMPTDRAFSAALGGVGAGQAAVLHVTSSSNTLGYLSQLDHPAINFNPHAQVLVQHVWNPPGYASNYHNHPVGVWFASDGRWYLWNEDYATMSSGKTFFVLVAGHPDDKSIGRWPDRGPSMYVSNPYIAQHVYTATNPIVLTTPTSIHRTFFYHPV